MKLQPGDAIVARRKVKSKIYHNTIVGPVLTANENCCRVITNAGTDIEADWQINYTDWSIDILLVAP